MFFAPPVAALGLLASTASAALSITNPVEGSVFHGASAARAWTFKVAWEESDNSTSPLTSDFGSSTIQLMVGSTYEQYVIANLTTLDPSTKSKYQASVDASVAGNSSDYFIRIRSNIDDTLESFSHKFTMSSMTGDFTAAEISAISVGLASTATASSSSSAAKSSSSSKKASAIATSVTSASTTSGSATATKANKAAETTIPAASGAQRVGLSAGAAVVVAGALALLA